MSTSQQLEGRWFTPEGKKVKKQIVEHIRESNWEMFLKKFSFIVEVKNKRDLRFIVLMNTYLERANLRGANLRGAYLTGANLRGANLTRAYLKEANLTRADLEGANLTRANLEGAYLKEANLTETDLTGADLEGAYLTRANLEGADLEGANLTGAYLMRAYLIEANLERANLTEADLRGANLTGADLKGANLIEAYLERANLTGADLRGVNLRKADLEGAYLREANLRGADLEGADLEGANLERANLEVANLTGANLTGADLREANLRRAKINETILQNCIINQANLSGADLTGAYIYGSSAWDIKTDKNTIMKNLVISKDPLVTIDDIEIAQFIYTILNNEKIRNVINTMRTKGVLILGSFYNDKKSKITLKKILDKIKEELLKKNYIPIVFDFHPSKKLDLISTVKTLALLSSFIIVDLSTPAGQLTEIGNLVRELPIPFIPIASNKTEHITDMVSKRALGNFHWFRRDVFYYLLNDFDKQLPKMIELEIIPWAKSKNKELEKDRED